MIIGIIYYCHWQYSYLVQFLDFMFIDVINGSYGILKEKTTSLWCNKHNTRIKNESDHMDICGIVPQTHRTSKWIHVNSHRNKENPQILLRNSKIINLKIAFSCLSGERINTVKTLVNLYRLYRILDSECKLFIEIFL